MFIKPTRLWRRAGPAGAHRVCGVNPVTGKREIQFVSGSCGAADRRAAVRAHPPKRGRGFQRAPRLHHLLTSGRSSPSSRSLLLPFSLTHRTWALPGGKIAVNWAAFSRNFAVKRFSPRCSGTRSPTPPRATAPRRKSAARCFRHHGGGHHRGGGRRSGPECRGSRGFATPAWARSSADQVRSAPGA